MSFNTMEDFHALRSAVGTAEKKRGSLPVNRVMIPGINSPNFNPRSNNHRSPLAHLRKTLDHNTTTGASTTSTTTSAIMPPAQPSLPPLVTAQHQHQHQSFITTTPSNNSSMVLLSPSRTIIHSLTIMANNTATQLEEIWDRVGYSPDDRAAQLSTWVASFKNLCESKIAEESEVEATFLKEIVESRSEIIRLSKALQTTIDEDSNPHLARILREQQQQNSSDAAGAHEAGETSMVASSASATPLADQLATLEAALEGLRSAASSIQQKLVECRDYLVEAHEALGLEIDKTWLDVDSDLSQARQEMFAQKKDEMASELASRTMTVIRLVQDCQHVMKDLEIFPENKDETFTELDQRIAGSIVRGKDSGTWVMASKHRTPTCVGISASAVDELTKRFAELHAEKRRRKEKLQELGADISHLWEKLKVPNEEMLAFQGSVSGLSLDTLRKGQMELDRLLAKKKAMLGNLIDEARSSIVGLWDQTNVPEADRPKAFPPFTTLDVSEELLVKHEEYIGVLTRRLEQMKPILRLIERREDIVKERMEYEELQKDSERLKQRGAALTKQLLEEEKMARRIKKELPRLTEVLEEKLRDWKQSHGEDFLYQGRQAYLELMEQQEDEWQRYKELELQRKLKKKQEESSAIVGGMNGSTGGASKFLGKENGKASRPQQLQNPSLKSKRGLQASTKQHTLQKH
jgi:Ase1/PRC1/MAP65 family protein